MAKTTRGHRSLKSKKGYSNHITDRKLIQMLEIISKYEDRSVQSIIVDACYKYTSERIINVPNNVMIEYFIGSVERDNQTKIL